MESAVLTAEAGIVQELPTDAPVCTCSGEEVDFWKEEAGQVVDGLSDDLGDIINAEGEDFLDAIATAANNQELRNVALERMSPPPCLQDVHDVLVLANARFQRASDLIVENDIEGATTKMDLGLDALQQATEKINQFDNGEIDCD